MADSSLGLPDLPSNLASEDALSRLRSHLRRCWEAGQPLPVETYFERFPDLFEADEEKLELIYQEWRLREEHGPPPDFGEYVRLFPAISSRLRDRLDEETPLVEGKSLTLGSVLLSRPQLHDRTDRIDLGEEERENHRPAKTAPCPAERWIGSFEILGELGRGGMGVVYHAWQHGLNRPVAMKMVLVGSHADPDDLQRFLREAEAVAHLHHPNIVQVYEVGQHEQCPYFTMEYVEGGSLTRWIGGRPQAARPTAELVETLARAVQHAHDKGIVHRDLKPANILLSFGRQAGGTSDTEAAARLLPAVPKITDFGLAKRLDTLDSNTRSGDVVGTPSYMAPEQARGDRHAVGPALDVYGLGTILYECLTGRAPFMAPTELDTLRQVLEDEPISPGRFQPRLPRDLATICLKCLRKAPHRRYASARDLADDLRRFLNAEPIKARPADALDRTWHWCRRRPARAALIGAVILVLAGAFFGEMRLLVEKHWQLQVAKNALISAVTMREAADVARTSAEKQLYFSRIALAERELNSGNVAGAEALLALGRDKDDVRGWEWGYLSRSCQAPLDSWPGHRSWVRAVAFGHDCLVTAGGDPFRHDTGQVMIRSFPTGADLVNHDDPSEVLALAVSPDGRVLVSINDKGAFRMVELPGGKPCQPELMRPEGEPVRAAAFSPDGRTLALGGDSVGLWDLATGEKKKTLAAGKVAALAFHRDSEKLAVLADDRLQVWDVVAGRLLDTATDGAGRALAYSPDGQFLAVAGESVRVWNAATMQVRLDLRRHDGDVYGLAFSPDSRLLASAGADHLVRVCEVRGGREVRVFRGHRAVPRCLTFSRDGSVLVSGGQDNAVLSWDMTAHPRALVIPRDHESGGEWVGDLTFAPGGQTILLVDQRRSRLLAMDLAGVPVGDVPLDLAYDFSYPRESCAFSRDGQWLAGPSAANPKAVKVWDATTGRERTTLPPEPLEVRALAFSPDGQRLAIGRARSHRPPQPEARGEVAVWDLADGARLHHWPEGLGAIRSLAFSPDGQQLAATDLTKVDDDKDRRSALRVWDLATGAEQFRVSAPLQWGQGLSFSPDGQLLALADFHAQRLYAFKTRTTEKGDVAGTEAFPARRCIASPTATAFSPDGRRLAVIGYDGTAELFDAEEGQAILTLPGLAGHRPEDYAYSARVVFSPDRRRLASLNWDGSVNLFDAGELTPEATEARRAEAQRRVPHWRLHQAQAAWKDHDRFAFDFYLGYLTSAPLADSVLVAGRGRLQAAVGQWASAREDLERAWMLSPTDARLGYETACAYLVTGDRDGYRQACSRLKETVAGTTSPAEADWLVKAYVLAGDLPERDPIWKDVERWQETASRPELALRPRLQRPWPYQRRGLVLFRAGCPAEAISVLEQSLQEDPDWPGHATTWLVLALAHHRLGQADAARQALQIAKTRLDAAVKNGPAASFGWEWTNAASARLWRKEAEALIAGGPPPP